MTENNIDRILSVKEVCTLLNCSIATIYRWESEGNLPFPKLKIGPSKVGFRKSDVDAFLREPETASA